MSSTLGYGDVSQKYFGLGIATALSLVVAGILMRLTNRVFGIPSYLKLTFEACKNNRKLTIALTTLFYLIVILPVVLLISWTSQLGSTSGSNPAAPIFLNGVFLIGLLVPVSGRFFYPKVTSLFVLLLVAQLVTMGLNWMPRSVSSFFSLTTVLFGVNGVFVSISLWFIDGSCWSLANELPEDLRHKIMDRIKIWDEIGNPPDVINGGMYSFICRQPKLKWGLVALSYILAITTLLAYSFITDIHTDQISLGWVNSVCLISTDIVLIMLIFMTRKLNTNPIANSLVVFAIRGCLVGFTGSYWFIGYCLLFLVLFTYICILFTAKRYPLYQKIPSVSIERINIFASPEMAGSLLIIFFTTLIYYVGNDTGKRFSFQAITLNKVTYPFWTIGIATLLLAFSVASYIVSVRIVERSVNRIRSITVYYIGCEVCSEYYIFLLGSYGLLVVLGFFMYNFVGSKLIWASCIFLPLIYHAGVVFFSNWVQNDYLILGSVTNFNKHLKKKRERIEKINAMKESVLDKVRLENPQAAAQLQKTSSGLGLVPAEDSKVELFEEGEVQTNIIYDVNVEKQAVEWREQMSFFEALKGGHLLPFDKRILISLAMMIPILIGYSILYFYIENSMTAFTISEEILFLFLAFTPMKRYFSTLERPAADDIILFVLGIVLNYGYGVASYNLWNASAVYTIFWAVLNPFGMSVYAVYAMIRDRGCSLVPIICSAISVLLLVVAGILLIALFKETVTGIAFIGVAIYYGYGLGVYLLYLYQKNSIPRPIYGLTAALVVLTCFAIMIYGFISPDLDDFYGFSITWLSINLLLVIYSGQMLIAEFADRFDRPNFYSPHGMPILKYDPKIKSVTKAPTAILSWSGAWFLFFVYSLLMQIFIVDTSIGIASSIIFLIIAFLTFMYYTSYNSYEAGKYAKDINEKMIRESWDEIQTLMESHMSEMDHRNIQKELAKYQQVAQKIAGIPSQVGPGTTPVTVNQNPEPVVKPVEPGPALNQAKTNENVKADAPVAVNDLNTCEGIIALLEERLYSCIENNKIMLVNFWIKIVFKCKNTLLKKMMQLTNFIKEDGEILATLGIAIVVDLSFFGMEFAYNKVIQEVQQLSPVQRVYFEKKFKEYLERKAAIDRKNAETQKKELQDQIKRDEELKRKLVADPVDDSKEPIQKMRDSPLKLQKIAESKIVFVDNAFPANKATLPEYAQTECKAWSRPDPGAVLIQKETAAMSVKQGVIGDCYLISAIGVLDINSLKRILGLDAKGWKNPPGAYMVKFRKYSQDTYVIIDDQFPVDDSRQWILGQSENSKELFTNVIEKAYAKLYNGYNKIVGGKVNLALSDMTGGFPEEIALQKYQTANINELFDTMVNNLKSGYLMGAGSPPNPQGDAAQVDGIVQGHAYLVLNVRDLDGNKLIKLRNPHGNQGRESTLDWCDSSPKWTKRILNLLAQSLVADGAFWMSIQDFTYCFRSLYVCRIFDPAIWRQAGPIAGKWEGVRAAGLPNKKNPAAKLADNPHYGIKVNRQSIVFVELTQNEITPERSGKNFIFLLAQKNDGKRIKTNSVNLLVGSSGSPINSLTVSAQLSLVAPSYPYTFSLLVSGYDTGATGSYNLMFYCNDPSFQVIDDSAFDI